MVMNNGWKGPAVEHYVTLKHGYKLLSPHFMPSVIFVTFVWGGGGVEPKSDFVKPQ